MSGNSLVTVRLASADDAQAIADVGGRSFRETFAASTRAADLEDYIQAHFTQRRIGEEGNDPFSTFFVASIGDEVIGFAKLHAGPPPECVDGQRPLELSRLYILADRIGGGVGASLMQACLQYARDAAYDVVWLGVWENNHRARKFYERWGFLRVGSHIFTVGSDDQIDILMALEVAR